MKEISLYIHIPFCKQKCFYCDFPSYAGKESQMEGYVDALVKEIEDKASNYVIKTIFIGGGTPSYLAVAEIEKLLKAISKLNISKDIEFTMECNPGVLLKEKLEAMKSGGVNRISFGLQSCNDNLLRGIGRIHSYNEFLKNYNLAREVGFNNINVDLMYGLPNQSVDDWKLTLETICKIKPEHISAYSLIIEEGTVFYKLYEEDKLNLPCEDEERVMNELTPQILKDYGYHKYEISNYAKEGKECSHNKVYWTMDEYIGAGVSSSSYINGERITNIDSISDYINCIHKKSGIISERHTNSKEDEMEEFVFMGLRMLKGIDIKKFKQKFGVNIESIYKDAIEKNIKAGLLVLNNSNMCLTEEGIEVSNYVMSDFILEKNEK